MSKLKRNKRDRLFEIHNGDISTEEINCPICTLTVTRPPQPRLEVVQGNGHEAAAMRNEIRDLRNGKFRESELIVSAPCGHLFHRFCLRHFCYVYEQSRVQVQGMPGLPTGFPECPLCGQELSMIKFQNIDYKAHLRAVNNYDRVYKECVLINNDLIEQRNQEMEHLRAARHRVQEAKMKLEAYKNHRKILDVQEQTIMEAKKSKGMLLSQINECNKRIDSIHVENLSIVKMYLTYMKDQSDEFLRDKRIPPPLIPYLATILGDENLVKKFGEVLKPIEIDGMKSDTELLIREIIADADRKQKESSFPLRGKPVVVKVERSNVAIYSRSALDEASIHQIMREVKDPINKLHDAHCKLTHKMGGMCQNICARRSEAKESITDIQVIMGPRKKQHESASNPTQLRSENSVTMTLPARKCRSTEAILIRTRKGDTKEEEAKKAREGFKIALLDKAGHGDSPSANDNNKTAQTQTLKKGISLSQSCISGTRVASRRSRSVREGHPQTAEFTLAAEAEADPHSLTRLVDDVSKITFNPDSCQDRRNAVIEYHISFPKRTEEERLQLDNKISKKSKSRESGTEEDDIESELKVSELKIPKRRYDAEPPSPRRNPAGVLQGILPGPYLVAPKNPAVGVPFPMDNGGAKRIPEYQAKWMSKLRSAQTNAAPSFLTPAPPPSSFTAPFSPRTDQPPPVTLVFTNLNNNHYSTPQHPNSHQAGTPVNSGRDNKNTHTVIEIPSTTVPISKRPEHPVSSSTKPPTHPKSSIPSSLTSGGGTRRAQKRALGGSLLPQDPTSQPTGTTEDQIYYKNPLFPLRSQHNQTNLTKSQREDDSWAAAVRSWMPPNSYRGREEEEECRADHNNHQSLSLPPIPQFLCQPPNLAPEQLRVTEEMEKNYLNVSTPRLVRRAAKLRDRWDRLERA